MAECNKGFGGCPGKVPLTSKQCKGHRFFARMKSKMEASMGKGPKNSWVKAVRNMKRVRHSQCLKECCSQEWIPSQQVAKQKLLQVDLELLNSNFRLSSWEIANQLLQAWMAWSQRCYRLPNLWLNPEVGKLSYLVDLAPRTVVSQPSW